MRTERTITRVSMLLALAACLWASGIIPAIIPQAVPAANKIGNSTKFQLGQTGAVSGDCAQFDASLNVTGPGTGAGCGSAGPTGGGLTSYSGLTGVALTGTVFFPFGGGAIASTTEADVATTIESSVDFSRLGASVSVAFGVGNSAAVTVRKNAADTTLTCTISGNSAVDCGDTTHTFSAVAGDKLDYKVIFGGTVLVNPVFKLVTQSGTLLSGTITSGTQGRFAYYSAASTISQSGASTAHAVALFEGTSAPGGSNVGTTGQCFQGVTGADPAFSACPSGGSAVTYGAIGSLPAAGTSGAVYVPSDSYYNMLFDNGAAWVYRGWDGVTVTPPVAGNFTNINTVVISAQTNGAITFSSGAGAGDNLRSYVLTSTPSTPYTRTFRIKPGIVSADFASCGAVFRESATGKLIGFNFGYTGSATPSGASVAISRWTNATTFSATSFTQQMIPVAITAPYAILRVSDAGVAGNLTYSISPDGINYVQLFTQARNAFFTVGPDQVGVYVNSNNASFAASCVLVAVD